MMGYKIWRGEEPDVVDGVDWGTQSSWEWNKCIECVIMEFECDARAALKLIYEQNGAWAHKEKKTNAFLKAQEECKKIFAAMGINLKGRQLYQVSRQSLVTIFEGLLPFLAQESALGS